MATTTDLDVQWYCERDVVAQTGLPGPLVAALLPHLPTPPGCYSTIAQVYDADSIQRALLVTQMLRFGVRLRYIRVVMAEPMTTDQLEEGITEWTTLTDSRATQAAPASTRRPPHQTLILISIMLFAIAALLLGIHAGITLGQP